MAEGVEKQGERAEQPKRSVTRWAWRAVLGLAVLGVLWFFLGRLCFALRGGGYVLPRDAADWSAWGTWVGGFTAAGALIFAGRQLRGQRVQLDLQTTEMINAQNRHEAERKDARERDVAAALRRANLFRLELFDFDQGNHTGSYLTDPSTDKQVTVGWDIGGLSFSNKSSTTLREVVLWPVDGQVWDFDEQEQEERFMTGANAMGSLAPLECDSPKVGIVAVLYPGDGISVRADCRPRAPWEEVPTQRASVPNSICATFKDEDGQAWMWTKTAGAQRFEADYRVDYTAAGPVVASVPKASKE